MSQTPRVVIIGAGFGGLRAAKALKKAPVEVLMLDRYNYHTFQPLLYQVAAAELDPEQIAHSVRGIYHNQKNFYFRLANVVGVDWEGQQVLIEEGEPIHFDYLILAAGASTNYFGIPGVKENAFPLKRITQAINLRSHIMRQFERTDANRLLIEEGVLTFVVVGGGPTGVEMAGALVELFDNVLFKDYHWLARTHARVVLIEAAERLLTPFHPSLSYEALKTLRDRGVDVILNDLVIRATPDAVHLKSGRVISNHTLIWAAGVRVNPLADVLGLEQTRGGRLVVNSDLSVPEQPNVFVIGDMAAAKDPDGSLLPQVAQVAIQAGTHAAKQIEHKLKGQATEPFRYFDPGIMATIGRHMGIVELPNGTRLSGFIGWLMWLFLHIMYLVGFRNRLQVFINWMWSYLTYDRSARLIFDVEPKAVGVSPEEQ